MDIEIQQAFLDRWRKYVPGAELPIVFYYTDEEGHGRKADSSGDWRCLIGDLGRVRQGTTMAFEAESLKCGGARRYLGYGGELGPDFDYFLSCGLPGKREGIRYKKTPELVRRSMERQPPYTAPGKYIVFKRWDKLDESDRPAAVIFFAVPDVLSVLFGLANFDSADPHMVIVPSGSGCSAIVYYPLQELSSDNPRAVLGMFDISARPYVPASVLTFAAPWPLFVRMAGNMDESLLITKEWERIKTRAGEK